jgi:hypothetical protein
MIYRFAIALEKLDVWPYGLTRTTFLTKMYRWRVQHEPTKPLPFDV